MLSFIQERNPVGWMEHAQNVQTFNLLDKVITQN